MSEIKQTKRVEQILKSATDWCDFYNHEFVMPEHLLSALLECKEFKSALNEFCDVDNMADELHLHMKEDIEVVPEGVENASEPSQQMLEVVGVAYQTMLMSEADAVDMPHFVKGLLELEDSWATYILRRELDGQEASFMSLLISNAESDEDAMIDAASGVKSKGEESWRKYVMCMNDHYASRNPLIGREDELNRTIRVLCRRDKNNPLHVGEPGVGKTALVWGLVRLIEEQNVPERLQNSRVYLVDVGSMLAGTQYRGDFENRIKTIMEGIMAESDGNIVYIDEIHTLVGAGAIGTGSMDASNMLKPYLESGKIRFIGSTTYDEYNRHFSKSKGLVRRFQQIDILEPTVEETKNILRQLQSKYEEFHGVTYSVEAIDYAVEASAKYINERFLPDKAIDIIDEAGAAMEMQAEMRTIEKSDIAALMAKTCKVETMAECEDDDYERLKSLSERILSKIYGQDEAIRQVVETVQMSRAGLLDENKPLASLLFVGPTGVGKTEVAKVLSQELGVELLRFDMSEYTEKHTVAKLIGSPAGYVGYEDGGLLTDAVRKTPHCVLLLDEIEKAHQDVYNILLQVMDYARLTDNKGRYADFRNVIIIMTSNAGAQYASQAIVGFNSTMSRGSAMMKEVKRVFKPEFLNRLSGTVVFNDMSREMAVSILQKKLRELGEKLKVKNVEMELSEDAFDHLLNVGFNPVYGAREMDRVISQQLKPVLMREILFGSMKQGGTIKIVLKDGNLLVG